MKKISLIVKENSENRIKDTLKESEAVFVIKYSGLSSPDVTALRQNLKSSSASFYVVKNSVARRALKDAGFEGLIGSVEGPCGLIFVKDEPVNVSKSLCAFAKEHDKLQFDSGYLKDKLLVRKDIEAMAKLPSKEVLRAQVVMTLNSPISRFVISLNQILRNFVYCLDQVKQKKTT
ncbi:MAG: 50S ribosomal protein L10 [Candidatus Omnitrophica bacterium]|nr:50S ribosomal protein L10 [Candidatus Omnitrophota bacterium]